MKRRNLKTRVVRVSDQGKETDPGVTTPSQRLGMMWQLALNAWAFKGDPVAEPRLQRYFIRLKRRES